MVESFQFSESFRSGAVVDAVVEVDRLFHARLGRLRLGVDPVVALVQSGNCSAIKIFDPRTYFRKAFSPMVF